MTKKIIDKNPVLTFEGKQYKINDLSNDTKVIIKDVSKSVLKVIMMAKLEQILNLE